MGIVQKLLGRGGKSDSGFQTVSAEENMREPVHDWFSEGSFGDSDAGVHPEDSGPDYGEGMNSMDDRSWDLLESAEMNVTEDMRDLIREGYRVVEIDNGEDSMEAAYMAWEDNIDKAFGDLLGQATYRTQDNEVVLPDGSIERAVGMMYDTVREINDELREQGVDAVGGQRNSSVRASGNASRYDSRDCMRNGTIVGWGEPGVNSHISFSVKRTDRDELPYGARDRRVQSEVEEIVKERMDFYEGRAYDQEGTVEEIGEEFRNLFQEQDEVEVTVDRKHRTDSVDRIMMDDTQVYNGQTFTYETTDWDELHRRVGRDRGLREFDSIAEIVEREDVAEYQEV
jgi:hypothetical protein